MISPATSSDMLPALQMLRAFYEEGLKELGLVKQESAMARYLIRLAVSPDACLLMGRLSGEAVGLIGGRCYHPWYNDDWLIAAQDLWYVKPSERQKPLGVRLLRAFEAWAREAGAEMVFMPFTAAIEPYERHKLLKRAGYSLVDVNYNKPLKQTTGG